MQSVRSANDGSLEPLRREIAELRRMLDRERQRRKLLREQVNVIMDFLDGRKKTVIKDGMIVRFRFNAAQPAIEEDESPA